MTELQEHIRTAAISWVNSKLDGIIEANPRLSVFSTHIRRGIHRKIDEAIPKLDAVMPFITDDNGKLDVVSISDELLNAFDEMPIRTYNFVGIDVKVGKGVITATAPRNILTDFFLDNGSMTLTRADIEELIAEIINQN